MKPKLELNLIPTTYGGPEFYHPAIRDQEWNIWYWPNVKCVTEQVAYLWAKKRIDFIYNHAQQIANEWHIFKV